MRTHQGGDPGIKLTSCRSFSARLLSTLRLRGNLPVWHCSTRTTANCRPRRCSFSLRQHEGDPDDSLLLESGVRPVAARLLDRGDRQPPGPARGTCSQLCSGSLIYEYLESYR
jgi:hypothetical protein